MVPAVEITGEHGLREDPKHHEDGECQGDASGSSC
jgi:hypothetical protein